ncbi:MAG TPA: MFS transporter, partial [Candidatus Avipropionibacterium avicola]|nr:MFS transporter [Candidatus Avipropionibacterium avicola]
NVSETSPSRLDLVSIPLTVLGFGGLVFGLNSLGEGASSPLLWVSLVLGVIGMGLFVWRQLALQRNGHPLLDLRVLTHQPFRVGLGIIMIGFAVLIGGVAILWPIYLQRVRLLDSITTGMLLLPGGLAMGLLGPWIGRLYDHYGAKVLAVPASTVMVGLLFAMSRVQADTPIWLLLGLHLTLSLSLAFMFTPVFTGSLNSLPPSLYSHGSATLNALQQVAGGAGTALLVALMASTRLSAELGGAAEGEAVLAGFRMALTVAAGIGVLAIALTLLLRKGPPESVDEPAPLAH